VEEMYNPDGAGDMSLCETSPDMRGRGDGSTMGGDLKFVLARVKEGQELTGQPQMC